VYRRRMRGYVRKERAILLNVMIPLRPFSSPAEVHKETTHLSAMSSEASFVDIGCPEDCYPTIIILCHCLSSPPPHVDDTGTSPIPMTKSVNHLDGVLPGPLSGRGFVSRSIRLVHVGDFWDKRVVGIGVRQHGANTQKHLRDR